MNILFLTLVQFNSLNESGIYTDLLREFTKHGHNVCAISPTEKRQNKPTCMVKEKNAKIQKQCQSKNAPALLFRLCLVCFALISGPFVLVPFQEETCFRAYAVHGMRCRIDAENGQKYKNAVSEAVICIKKTARNKENDPAGVFLRESEIGYNRKKCKNCKCY
jgi:hypothetical protein